MPPSERRTAIRCPPYWDGRRLVRRPKVARRPCYMDVHMRRRLLSLALLIGAAVDFAAGLALVAMPRLLRDHLTPLPPEAAPA